MPIGLVTIMAMVTALGTARLRLRPPVPDASRRARSLALAAHPEENLGCACALTSVGITSRRSAGGAERPAWLAMALP